MQAGDDVSAPVPGLDGSAMERGEAEYEFYKRGSSRLERERRLWQRLRGEGGI